MTTPRTRLAGKLAALALCTATTAAQALPPDADLLGMSSYVAAGGYYTAHLVPESAVGQDLDGDGMVNDLVLHYRHVDSDESISTGIPAYGFRIETDGSNILFLQAERNVNADLNGDRDRRDVVLAYYTIADQTVHYTDITPHLNVGWHGQLRIRIVDRSKDMIITGGFNVYPNEVEQVISEDPAVQECAVIGVPDEKWGEAVKGIVLLRPGSDTSEAQLIDLVKSKLGSVKAPKSIDFVDELPKSPVGKVLKTELRKPYWSGRDRAVN